jgi:methylenetetrahydrofolate reductase (NADPH)
VKPVTTVRQLATIPREFRVELPEELVELIGRAGTPAEAARAGVSFTVRLCRGLLAADAPGLHFYTMGRGRAVTEVLKELAEG